MFPGAHAQVYRNEAGEVTGWDAPLRDDECYDPDAYLRSDDDDDESDDDEEPALFCEADARRGTGTGVCERLLDRHGYCDRASAHV